MKNKYLSEKEITDELNDYLYNVNIKYAVLLNGSWGSGKTYFIKKYIENLEQKFKENKSEENGTYKKPVYISLYGINSISEIKNKMLLSLVKNKKVKQFLPLLDVGLEIGSEFISDKTFIKNSDNKLGKILGSLYKIENLILIFDDLERCNININSVLGYINELVEHNNIKVIIVADETKIGKLSYDNNLELKYMLALSDKIDLKEKQNDNYSLSNSITPKKTTFAKEEVIQRAKNIFNEDSTYNEIKEKLIGKTIFYHSNIKEIYEIFVQKILTNENAKDTAIRNKELFLTQLENNNYYNLRTVQFIFQTFNRLVKETINLINFEGVKDVYLNDLFSYCIIKSLKIKQGKNSYNWENNQEFGTIYLGNEVIDYIYKNFVTGFRFVDDYLLHSMINKDKIKNTLNEYKNMIINDLSNPNDPLYKLKTWWLISEKDLCKIIDDLIKNIKNNDYGLEVYSKIVMLLSHIEEMNICISKLKKAIKELENNIKDDKVKGIYYEDHIWDTSPKTAELYKKNISVIKELVNNKENNDIKKSINDIFNSDNWGIELKEYCEKNDSKFMTEKKFAYILDIDLIIKNIKSKNIEQIYEFWYALQKVYHFSNIKEFYENDKEILVNLKYKLSDIKEIDKVKEFVINKIILFLDDVISNL